VLYNPPLHSNPPTRRTSLVSDTWGPRKGGPARRFKLLHLILGHFHQSNAAIVFGKNFSVNTVASHAAALGIKPKIFDCFALLEFEENDSSPFRTRKRAVLFVLVTPASPSEQTTNFRKSPNGRGRGLSLPLH